jgi:LPXTG-motif cell wall-anchored protein
MNSKIKMVLGVLLVFALLSPIYAIETPIDILPHDPIVDPEDGTDDNESDLVDKIEFPRLGDFPDSPGSIVGKPIVGPEDGTDDNESDIRRGGGTRIVAETPAPTVQANAPAPAPVGPIVVTQPTPVVNTPTTPTTPTTGGTPTTTPTETTPITGNVTAVNPTGTSGATGFLGLPSTSAGTMGMIVGALLVIGAIGYFFFFRK